VRERIEYRFKVPSVVVFTLYSCSKALEYRFRVSTTGSLIARLGSQHWFAQRGGTNLCWQFAVAAFDVVEM
jgi:hypothetical protein